MLEPEQLELALEGPVKYRVLDQEIQNPAEWAKMSPQQQKQRVSNPHSDEGQ